MSTDSEEDEEYNVECILEEKLVKGKTHYLVKWEGYDDETWEPAAHMAKTEALADWKKSKGKTPTKSSAKADDDDDDDNDDDDDDDEAEGDDEDYESDSEPEVKAKAKPKAVSSKKTPLASKGKSPATNVVAPKVVAKRQRDEADDRLPEVLTADVILSHIESWDGAPRRLTPIGPDAPLTPTDSAPCQLRLVPFLRSA